LRAAGVPARLADFFDRKPGWKVGAIPRVELAKLAFRGPSLCLKIARVFFISRPFQSLVLFDYMVPAEARFSQMAAAIFKLSIRLVGVMLTVLF